MSKLVIFLCVVVIASAVNASPASDAIASAEAKVEEFIVATINATKEKIDDTKSKAVEHVAKLKAAAKSANEKVSQQVKSTLEQARAEIDKLARRDAVSEITDCDKLVSHLENTAFAVIGNMSGCVDDKLATGSGYAQNIVTLSEKVLANLTAIRETASHCHEMVGDRACINIAALQAAWVETTAVPLLMIEITKITNSLATLLPSLAYCSTTNGFDTFYHESSTIVVKTKQCIHHMRHEARPGTEEVATDKA